MTVYDLIQKLTPFSPHTPVRVITGNFPEVFSVAWGGDDGCTPETAHYVGLCVDRLNQSERTE